MLVERVPGYEVVRDLPKPAADVAPSAERAQELLSRAPRRARKNLQVGINLAKSLQFVGQHGPCELSRHSCCE